MNHRWFDRKMTHTQTIFKFFSLSLINTTMFFFWLLLLTCYPYRALLIIFYCLVDFFFFFFLLFHFAFGYMGISMVSINSSSKQQPVAPLCFLLSQCNTKIWRGNYHHKVNDDDDKLFCKCDVCFHFLGLIDIRFNFVRKSSS